MIKILALCLTVSTPATEIKAPRPLPWPAGLEIARKLPDGSWILPADRAKATADALQHYHFEYRKRCDAAIAAQRVIGTEALRLERSGCSGRCDLAVAAAEKGWPDWLVGAVVFGAVVLGGFAGYGVARLGE